MPAKKPSPAKAARSAPGQVLVSTALAGSGVATIKFGAVSVKATSPKVGELRRNVTNGQAAFARVAPRLVKPGVAFTTVKSTPLFRADPRDPSQLIREMNGKVSTGKFVDGKFKVLSTKK